MERLWTTDLLQLVFLLLVGKVEGPQCRLLQNKRGTAQIERIVVFVVAEVFEVFSVMVL